MTSSPNLIENIQALPGISDHLAIIFDVNLKHPMPKKPSGKVYQFHKADKISLKMKAKAVLDKFIKSDPTKNDIIANWCTTKSILNNLLNDFLLLLWSPSIADVDDILLNDNNMKRKKPCAKEA